MPPRQRDNGRWPAWLATGVLAVVWVGLGFVPGLHPSWIWLGRAAIFFAAAAILWFAYDPVEPDEGI
jgi:hypothetical protein